MLPLQTYSKELVEIPEAAVGGRIHDGSAGGHNDTDEKGNGARCRRCHDGMNEAQDWVSMTIPAVSEMLVPPLKVREHVGELVRSIGTLVLGQIIFGILIKPGSV